MGNETRQRQQRVMIRLNDAEHAALMSKAEKSGLPLGAYARQVLLDVAPRGRRRPHVDAVLLLQVLGRLGPIGSNINQLARVANSGGWPDGRYLDSAYAEIAEVCDSLWAALGRGRHSQDEQQQDP
jgi:hypothetical protein